MERFVLIAAVVLSLPLTSYAQRSAAPDARSGIANTWAAFEPLWFSGNVDQAVATFFTSDAMNMVPGAASDSGHAAIAKGFAGFFSAYKVSDVVQTTDEVQAAGGTAYERGSFQQAITPKNGQPASTQRSRYLAVWKQQPDGKWKCARFLFNDVPRT